MKLDMFRAARLENVNLLALSTAILLPRSPSFRFIPFNCFVFLKTLTGPALTTAPAIRIGTNAAHNNIAPTFTVPLSVTVDQMGAMPLAAPLKAPNIDAVDIIFEVLTAGIGPTTMTGDVLLLGLYTSFGL